MASRDERGRFASKQKKRKRIFDRNVRIDHNYTGTNYCDGYGCEKNCSSYYHAEIPKGASRDSWRHGRRVIEFGHLLNSLKYCSECKLGPIPLTEFNVVGELRKGLGGYLYVRCENQNCLFVNRVPYGKTHRQNKTTGMPCFVANTKLGIGVLHNFFSCLFFFKNVPFKRWNSECFYVMHLLQLTSITLAL